MTFCYMATLLQAPQLEPGTHLQNFSQSPKPVLSSLHIPDTTLSYFCILSNAKNRREDRLGKAGSQTKWNHVLKGALQPV